MNAKSKIVLIFGLVLVLGLIIYAKYGASMLPKSMQPKSVWDEIKEGNNVKVKKLIDSGKVPVSERNIYGQRLLDHSVIYCNMEIFDYLIDNGADIFSKDNDGRYPLHWAALNGCTQAVKYFYNSGVDINEADKHGFTPLIYSAMHGNTEIAAYLISRGADIDAQNSDGKTALYMATKNIAGWPDFTQVLIDNGADIDIKANDGTSALDIAQSMGRKEIEQQLLAAYASAKYKEKSKANQKRDAVKKTKRPVKQKPMADDFNWRW